jgi:3-oxoadipate enol-lactonase
MIGHVETASGRLTVRVDGDADLPWLILGNSLASDMSLWDPQMPLLTRHRRVLRFDHPGHGASGRPARELTMARLAEDVVFLMDHHRIGQADFLGLSLGGMTAMGLALDHPGRIRRAVTACARASFPPPAMESWDQRLAAVRSGGMRAVAGGTIERWFTPGAPQALREAAERMILGTSVEGYSACIGALKGLDYARRLGDIRIPMLYIAGLHDTAAPPAAMEEMAAATPGSRFATIANAAHIANMEAAPAFDRAVAEFLFADG